MINTPYLSLLHKASFVGLLVVLVATSSGSLLAQEANTNQVNNISANGSTQVAPLLASTAGNTSTQSTRPWISLGGVSYHLQRANEFNQTNPGIGVEWPVQAPWTYETRIAFGGFKNSESARSLYAGAFIFPFSSASGQFKAGALLGMIDGYKGANAGGFFPLAVPTIAYETGHIGANLFLIPPVSTIPPTLAVQLKFRF